jgi:hypothetical protein
MLRIITPQIAGIYRLSPIRRRCNPIQAIKKPLYRVSAARCGAIAFTLIICDTAPATCCGDIPATIPEPSGGIDHI